METRAQRHLGSTTTAERAAGQSFISKYHWGLIAALIAVIIAVILIAEVIHRRRTRRRKVVPPVPGPKEPTPAYLLDPPDKLTREDWEDIERAKLNRRKAGW